MIQLITYATPHRKTQDTLLLLKASGYSDVVVLATPWVERAKKHTPLLPHRPWEAKAIDSRLFTERLGYTYTEVRLEDLPLVLDPKAQATLLCGAGILPETVVSAADIINAHPAYLPFVRGLDALKWAIYENKPIGVTTHIIDANADAGILITQEEIPLYPWDTFHSVAFRQYEKEIALLVSAVIDVQTCDRSTKLDTVSSPVYKRMPHEKEKELLALFEKRKQELFAETV